MVAIINHTIYAAAYIPQLDPVGLQQGLAQSLGQAGFSFLQQGLQQFLGQAGFSFLQQGLAQSFGQACFSFLQQGFWHPAKHAGAFLWMVQAPLHPVYFSCAGAELAPYVAVAVVTCTLADRAAVLGATAAAELSTYPGGARLSRDSNTIVVSEILQKKSYSSINFFVELLKLWRNYP